MLSIILPCLALVASGQLLPAQTIAVDNSIKYLGWTPAPTPAPRVAGFDISRRQGSAFTSLCGYVQGNISDPVTCAATAYCGFNSAYSVFGCCDNIVRSTLTNCGFYTTCYDAAQVPAECDSTCQEDPTVWYCGDANPYCMSFVESGYTAFGCTTAANQRYSVQQTAAITTSSTRPNSTAISSRITSSMSSVMSSASLISSSSASFSQIPFTETQRTALSSETSLRPTSSIPASSTGSAGKTTTIAATTTTTSTTSTNGTGSNKKEYKKLWCLVLVGTSLILMA